MNNYNKNLSNTGNLTKTISFDGYEFDIESDNWRLNKDNKFSVEYINKFDKSIQDDIRSTLVYFAEQKSAGYAVHCSKIVLKYQRETEELLFSELGLLSFKSILGTKRENSLAILRTFLKQMYSLGYGAIDGTCLELLNGWRLSGGDRGIPVLSLCPEDGPFSDIEFEAILDGLDNGYAEGNIDNKGYVTAQLFAATGRRPIQIAALKIGDLRIDSQLLDTPVYILNIPRAKVRGQGFRSEFTDCALADYIGQVLNQYIQQLKQDITHLIGREISQAETQLLPIYPNFNELLSLKGLTEADSISLLNLDVLHTRTQILSTFLTNTINNLNITSERTKEKMHINAYRFRYTLGTRAARENAGVLTIATLLDHSDSQHAGVYVQNHPDHAATISTIMNAPLMKYANAFQGIIVKDEQEAQTELPNAQRIRTEDSAENIGSCGTNTFCEDYAPIACYLCPKFRPWQDAPHYLVLNHLVSERDRISQETKDLAIASINDRAIIAVTQVIKQCYELNNSKVLANV